MDQSSSKLNPYLSRLKDFWQHSSFAKYLPVIVIGAALPITVFVAMQVQHTKNFAGGGGISSVDINPGSVNLSVGQRQDLSTIAYNYGKTPIFSGVAYEWSMSSDNSVATLSKTVSDITELTALNSGCGELTVIARDGISTITKSIPVIISDSSSSLPKCASISPGGSDFNWNIGGSVVQATGVYILINDKKFFVNMGSPIFSGSSTVLDSYHYRASLSMDWYESGAKMSGNIIIDYGKDGTWTLEEVKTTDGTGSDNWITYGPTDQNGKLIQGNSSYTANNINLISVAGRIHLESLTLTNFPNLLFSIAPFASPTPIPTLVPPTPTPGTPYQLSMTCTPNEILSNSSTKVIKATLVYAKTGVPVAGKSITWTRTGNSSYPLISPSSSTTDVGGTAYTNIWMPQGFSGSGSTSINAVFSGDSTYYSTACNTKVSYNIGATPTPTTFTPTPTPSDIPTPTPSPTPRPTATPTPAPSKALKLSPVADAYVRNDTPNTNYGSDTRLMAKGNPKMINFVKFDLSALNSKVIKKATLSIKVADLDSAQSGSTENIEYVGNSNWLENKINYSNRPIPFGQITSFKAGTRNTYYNIDLTSWVNSYKGSLSSFAIENFSTDGLIINSKEASVGKPTLTITYQ